MFHFCRQQQIKFRAEAVSHESEDCFDYSPDNPKSNSGSGLLGTGARGEIQPESPAPVTTQDDIGEQRAPSNVIEVKTESSQGSHSAPFPRALVEFFVKAFSDPGDVVFDPLPRERNHDGRSARAGPRGLRLRDLAGVLRRDPAPDRASGRNRTGSCGHRREVLRSRGAPGCPGDGWQRFAPTRLEIAFAANPNGMPCYGAKGKP